MLKGVIIFFALSIAQTVNASVPRLFVGEAFTTVWCSYCPNARCGLAQMEDEFPGQFFYIDIHKSDTDPFSSPETEARCEIYNVNAVPHVMIDGRYFIVGAETCEWVADIYRVRIQSRISETNGVSPVDVTGNFSFNENVASVYMRTELLDPGTFTSTEGTIFLYEDVVEWCCGYGGEDTWSRVVRSIRTQPMILEQIGDQAIMSENIEIQPDWNIDNLHVLAVFQETVGYRFIIQAAQLQRVTNNVSEWIHQDKVIIYPNPSSNYVKFNLPKEKINFKIMDSQGRIVRTIYREDIWDCLDEQGNKVNSGVYFIYLNNRLNSKIILVK